MTKHEIVVIGAGNVAYHLAHQFKNAGHSILQIFSRTEAAAEFLAEEVQAAFTDDLEKLNTGASLYVMAVNDDSLEELAEEIYLPGKIVVHTSAIVPMEALEPVSEKFGVFYPLQTMTKGHDLDFSEIPIFIEAEDEEVRKTLAQLAASISGNVQEADFKKRKTLHIAAVFANNFTNHLYHISETLLKCEGLQLEILLPLIKETVRKINRNNPFDVQTGPAKRGDMKTVEEHLEYLNEFPEFREIYLVLTESLISAYKKPIRDDE